MAKVTGFNGVYSGLTENEAWQRIYEYGKNLMPIKERLMQKKYNKIFNSKYKVIRDNALLKIKTDRLVPGDIIVLEKGDFVPVDGKVLEENGAEFESIFVPEDNKFSKDFSDKVIYQGMKLKRGRIIIEAIRTSDNTFLGGLVKKADKRSVCECNIEKALHKYANVIGSIGIILLFFGAVFSFVNSEGDIINRLSTAGYSGLLLFLATVPVGAVLVSTIKLIEQKGIIKRSNLTIKKFSVLLKAHKTTVICLDDRFLTRDYEKYIQRFYSAGIMVSVISKKGKEEVEDLAKKAKIVDENVKSISGKELANIKDEEFYDTICENVIFYEVSREMKERIIAGFDYLNIKTISIIDTIDDLPMLEHIDIAICTHKKKKNLEYEFSDAYITGTEITSVYSLIKGSHMIKNYFNHYLKYYIMFQLPVVLSLLVGLLANLDLKIFYLQTLIFIVIIVPLLLLLTNRDYSEEKIFDLKKKDKTFALSCLKFGFIGFGIGVICIVFYKLLSYFEIFDTLKISFITILLTTIYFIIIFISRRKFGVKKSRRNEISDYKNTDNKKTDESIKEEKNIESEKKPIKIDEEQKETIKEKNVFGKNKRKEIEVDKKAKKEKIINNKKKSSIEDIRDEIM